MRAPLFMMAAMLLGGCADMRTLDKSVTGGFHPPANDDHPRAEAVLARNNRPAPAPAPAAAPVRDSSVDAAATLREGVRLYNIGEFNSAIAKLSAPEIQNADAATRTSALKYTAFSYCVTQRPVPCRQAFDKALRIDARFELAPGEEGHPMWSPVFEKARASRQATGAG
jgi:hypothetical protein